MTEIEQASELIGAYLQGNQSLREVALSKGIPYRQAIVWIEDDNLIKACDIDLKELREKEIAPLYRNKEEPLNVRLVSFYVNSHLTAPRIAELADISLWTVRGALKDPKIIEKAGVPVEKVRSIGKEHKAMQFVSLSPTEKAQLIEDFILSKLSLHDYLKRGKFTINNSANSVRKHLVFPDRVTLLILGMTEEQYSYYLQTTKVQPIIEPEVVEQRARHESLGEIARDLEISVQAVQQILNHRVKI